MEATARKIYTVDEDLMPVIKGEVALPNVEDLDQKQFLSHLASGGHSFTPKWGYSNIDGRKQWTFFFLFHNQAGSFTGEGYAVRYSSGGDGARTMRFAICKHEAVAGANANPRRGWHPARCKHCGLDMTVDSGD